MKVLIIGGSGFMGPSIVSELRESGHGVTVFHRGNAANPEGAEQILGDRK